MCFVPLSIFIFISSLPGLSCSPTDSTTGIIFIYKAILGLFFPISPVPYCWNIFRRWFSAVGLLHFIKVCIDRGKKSFQFAAPSDGNQLHKDVNLKKMVPFNVFKATLSQFVNVFFL